MQRPDSDEYDPFYSTYVDKVPRGDIIDLMASGLAATRDLLGELPADVETLRYADGKWSLREVLGHVIDTERTFGYRALAFARGDRGRFPGLDQEIWSGASNAHRRPMAELLDEFELVRRGHIAMFGALDESSGLATGVASGCRFTVRALAYIIVGHERHHRLVIEERYLT